VAKRNPPSAPANSSHKLEIAKFHNEPAFVGVEKPVDFRLADWLPKGDAGEHFKARLCHLKICAVLATACSNTLMVLDSTLQHCTHEETYL
jgi:hypothetical protein